jgi:hypothetical protein
VDDSQEDFIMNLMDKYQKKASKTPPESKGRGIPFPPPCGYVIIYSRILNDYLLLTDTESRADALRAGGIEEPIYTAEEIKRLDGLPPESIRAHYLIKKTFPSKIEDEITDRK